MSSAHKMVSLPPERHAQLKEVAEALGGITMADQGLIPHGIPGVQIDRLSNGVDITFEGAEPAEFSVKGSRELAAALRNAIDVQARLGTLINFEHKFTVARRGQGITVRLTEDGPHRLLTRDLALDLAELIERAAQP